MRLWTMAAAVLAMVAFLGSVGCGESTDERLARAEANAANALNRAIQLERRLAAVEARLRM